MIDTGTLVDIIALIIGSIGGIPKILEFLRSKPKLRINNIRFERLDAGPADRLIVEIQNTKRLRPAMATNVFCLYVISKDDGTQLADNYDRTKTIGNLAPGKKRTCSLACQRMRDLHVNTVEVYIKVYCDEGTSASRTFKNVNLSKTKTRAAHPLRL